MFRFLFHRVPAAAIAALIGIGLLGGAALAWTGHIEGRPTSFHAGATDGYYIWHNSAEDRFHLRTTDSAGVFRYTGVLRTNGHFTDVEMVKAESDDHVQVLDGGHVIRFEFLTAEGIDGIDFNVAGGSRIILRLARDGHRIDPSQIFLGEDGVHPQHNPFVVRRERLGERAWQSSGTSVNAATTPTPVAE